MAACLIACISLRYGQEVTEQTELGKNGIGLDDTVIRTDLYATVATAVQECGCKLRHFGPDDLVQCRTVGDAIDNVFTDLIAA